VLGTLGAAWAFTINAWSFVAVIVALLLVRVPRLAVTRVPRHERPGVLREFFDAARGVRRYPGIRACFVAVVALGIAQGPLLGLLPVFTKEVFGVADLYYGLLVGALGLGAIVAAPLVAGRGSALPKGRLTLVGMTAYSLALVALGLSPVYLFAFLALVVAGMAYLSLASTLNTTIQVQVEEAIRGKVLALYVMLLTTAIPVGALIGAGLVHVVGPRGVVMLCGTFFLLVALWLWRGNDWLAHMDDDGPLPEVAVA
jgi:predicted MFS family arabinose efflux permease